MLAVCLPCNVLFSEPCYLIQSSHESQSYATITTMKLDGVGPVDNRPSTDQLHHFIQILKRNFFYT